jgi:5-formyltetrahydrofolate cyclo-ligase
MVLVPLLAFDKQGNRVGYGKGYYDRFLSTCTNARSIGISLFQEPVSIDGLHEKDKSLNHVLTPQSILTFP